MHPIFIELETIIGTQSVVAQAPLFVLPPDSCPTRKTQVCKPVLYLVSSSIYQRHTFSHLIHEEKFVKDYTFSATYFDSP